MAGHPPSTAPREMAGSSPAMTWEQVRAAEPTPILSGRDWQMLRPMREICPLLRIGQSIRLSKWTTTTLQAAG